MPTQLPSGQWRTRVRHPRSHKLVGAHTVIGGLSTFPDRASAKAAEDHAAALLASNARVGVTVREFWTEWTTDPRWLRPSESTNLHNHERTRKFVAQYGKRPVRGIDAQVVAEWLKGGRNRGTVPALRAFFNDAKSTQAGALVASNPFARLRLRG